MQKFDEKDYTETNPKSEIRNPQYILIWHSSIDLDAKIYFPGDKIAEDIYQKMPPSLKIHWWEIGRELSPNVFTKLSRETQKYFKIKTS